MRWRRSARARSTALAISSWPGRYSKGRAERARTPPGAKNSWRDGRARVEVSAEGIRTASIIVTPGQNLGLRRQCAFKYLRKANDRCGPISSQPIAPGVVFVFTGTSTFLPVHPAPDHER